MKLGRFIVGVLGGGGQARAKARTLLDLCWPAALLVQCEPDEPTGLEHTWYYVSLARILVHGLNRPKWSCAMLSDCCILTRDRAINQRFSTQDAPLKISGSGHVVEKKYVGVMKWYIQMSTWDTGSLSLGVSALVKKKVVSHESTREWMGALQEQWPTAVEYLRPRSREVLSGVLKIT